MTETECYLLRNEKLAPHSYYLSKNNSYFINVKFILFTALLIFYVSLLNSIQVFEIEIKLKLPYLVCVRACVWAYLTTLGLYFGSSLKSQKRGRVVLKFSGLLRTLTVQ